MSPWPSRSNYWSLLKLPQLCYWWTDLIIIRTKQPLRQNWCAENFKYDLDLWKTFIICDGVMITNVECGSQLWLLLLMLFYMLEKFNKITLKLYTKLFSSTLKFTCILFGIYKKILFDIVWRALKNDRKKLQCRLFVNNPFLFKLETLLQYYRTKQVQTTFIDKDDSVHVKNLNYFVKAFRQYKTNHSTLLLYISLSC